MYLSIDPGNTQSAYCLVDRQTLKPVEFDLIPNDNLLDMLSVADLSNIDGAAVEMVASYGMAVGREVFDTCVWIGRFTEALKQRGIMPETVFRMEEKLHICHDSRAKDANIRTALIDRFAAHDLKNGRGTKKNPDFFYGFRKDIWAAYAVGITAIERKK